MNAKIIVYYFESGFAAFRTFSSTYDTIEIVGNKDNWPLLVDLAFEPELASSVCDQLFENPKFAYASKSFANANLPNSCEVLHDRNVKISERDGFAILKYFGTELTTNEEVSGAIAESPSIDVQADDNRASSKVLATQVSELELSVRATNVFAAENYKTIGDLLSLREIDMLALLSKTFNHPNFSRKTLNEVIGVLGDYGLKLGNETEAYSKRYNNYREEQRLPNTMIERFRQALASIHNNRDNREINVILLRGENRTLEEIGQRYGVTRERIRQIEAKAHRKLKHPSRNFKATYWSDKLHKIFDQRRFWPVTMEDIGEIDEGFSHQEHERGLLSYIIRYENRTWLHFVEFDGNIYLSRMNQKTLDVARLNVKNLMVHCLGNTLNEIELTAEFIVPPEGLEFAGLLVEDALKHSIFEQRDGHEVLLTYSERRSGLSV
jgi:RNA polymerase sigma factor (sigma-70 family)